MELKTLAKTGTFGHNSSLAWPQTLGTVGSCAAFSLCGTAKAAGVASVPCDVARVAGGNLPGPGQVGYT